MVLGSSDGGFITGVHNRGVSLAVQVKPGGFAAPLGHGRVHIVVPCLALHPATCTRRRSRHRAPLPGAREKVHQVRHAQFIRFAISSRTLAESRFPHSASRSSLATIAPSCLVCLSKPCRQESDTRSRSCRNLASKSIRSPFPVACSHGSMTQRHCVQL